MQRIVLQLYLQQIEHIERQITDLDQALAAALAPHQDAIELSNGAMFMILRTRTSYRYGRMSHRPWLVLYE